MKMYSLIIGLVGVAVSLQCFANPSHTVLETMYVKTEFYETSKRTVLFYKDCERCKVQETTIAETARLRINGFDDNIKNLFSYRFDIKPIISISISKSTNLIDLVSVSMESKK